MLINIPNRKTRQTKSCIFFPIWQYSPMNGKEFGEWMDKAGMSLDEASTYFGVSAGTLYKWRSTPGVPESRAEWVQARMLEYIANQGISELPNRVILEPTRDQWRAWGRAALVSGMLLDDWAVEALDDAAADDEAAHATGSGDALNPVQSLKVADDGAEYSSKKGAGA
jgi:DNA-binding transcriptional regulator YiaG